MKYLKILLITLSLLMPTAGAWAAPLTHAFKNDYQIDSLYLFITQGDVDFVGWINLPKDWEVGIDGEKTLSAAGPVLDPGRVFVVRFSDRGSFTLEWTELLNGVIQGAGSLYALNGRFVGSSDNFTSAVPISGSIWLLGSGVIGLVFIRRRLADTKP